MKLKKIIGIGTALVVLFLVLANVPSGTAFLPGAGSSEQSLLPDGVYWSFQYGYDSTYGVYVRNIDWDPDGPGPASMNYYIGMVSIPWVEISEVIFNLPGDDPEDRDITYYTPFNQVYKIIYTDIVSDELNDYGITITIELIHGNPNAQIEICADLEDLTEPVDTFQFAIGIRADLDISPSPFDNDEVLLHSIIDDEGIWADLGSTIEYDISSTTYDNSEWHDTIILQKDIDDEEVFDGKTIGITPSNTEHWDTFYVLRSKPNEYDLHPEIYENNEDFDGQDIVIWDATGTIDEPSDDTLTVNLWITTDE